MEYVNNFENFLKLIKCVIYNVSKNRNIGGEIMNKNKEDLILIGKVMGAREMLLNIQKQALVNNGVITLESINMLNAVCEVQESMFNIEKYEGVIDRDIRLQSIAIAKGEISPTKKEPVKSPREAINIYTDGGSRGNPGISGCGCVIKLGDKVIKVNKNLGVGTNNEAEYEAVILALKTLEQIGVSNASVNFYADSQLVVKQLSREWKIKEQRMLLLAKKIWDHIKNLGLTCTFNYIPRNENSAADKLANDAMDGIIYEAGSCKINAG